MAMQMKTAVGTNTDSLNSVYKFSSGHTATQTGICSPMGRNGSKEAFWIALRRFKVPSDDRPRQVRKATWI